jgi:F0F1-type ATP synthase epsilon subunit
VIVLADRRYAGRDLDEARANKARHHAERELARGMPVWITAKFMRSWLRRYQLATIHRYLKK